MISNHENLDSKNKLIKLSSEEIKFISGLCIPNILLIPTNSEFDTQYINPHSNVWVFNYGGYRTQLNMDCNDELLTKLLKYIYSLDFNKYCAPIQQNHFQTIKSIFCSLDLSSKIYFHELTRLGESKKDSDIRCYFELKRICRHLFRIGFPKFDLNDYDKLEEIPIPLTKNSFLIYQDIDNSLPSHLKRLISKSLIECSTIQGLSSLTKRQLYCITILGLAFSTGMRSIQFAKLKVSSIKREVKNPRSNLIRFSIEVPLAKQRKIGSSA